MSSQPTASLPERDFRIESTRTRLTEAARSNHAWKAALATRKLLELRSREHATITTTERIEAWVERGGR